MIIRVVFYCALPILLVLLLVSRRMPEQKAPAVTEAEPAPPGAEQATESGTPDLTAMTAALVAAIPKDASAEDLFAATCAACHGAKGEGSVQLKTPSIAGIPDWFSLVQFEKFRNGQRGEGEGDVGGTHMGVIADNIDEALLPALAEHVAALAPVPTTNELGGDPGVGKDLFMEHCAGCHRYNAHGEKAFRSAPLSNLQDWYLLSSLIKFRDEVRGYHRNDIDGIFMHRNLKYVSDDDFVDIVAYIAELAIKYPPDQRRPRADGERARDLIQ